MGPAGLHVAGAVQTPTHFCGYAESSLVTSKLNSVVFCNVLCIHTTLEILPCQLGFLGQREKYLLSS